MFPLTHNQLLKIAVVGAIVAFSAAGTPARADEMAQNLGPVGPHEPILATIGNKRVIAFYAPGTGTCDVQAVIWNGDDTDAVTAAGMRVSLDPGQTAYIDSIDNKSLTLRCGDYAETLAAADTEHSVASK